VLAAARQGGLERVVEMLAAEQGSRAHVAAVLAPDDMFDHPFVEHVRASGVPITVIAVHPRAYHREFSALRRVIRDVSPDVVHTHGYHADIVGGAAARTSGVATVSTAHGFTGGGLRNRIYEILQTRALRSADAVIAVSRTLVERLTRERVRPERLHHIRNGYVPATPLGRAEARERLGLDPATRVVGWVGRFSREKGADVMIAALTKAGGEWRLSMVGAGGEREALENDARSAGVMDRVIWHGGVPHAGALMRAFDAFVLSSRTEGTPIALLEAMAAGVPVVATRVGGVPDVVGDADAILVAPDQPAAIGAALDEIARDPGAAVRRAESARARLEREFGAAAWLRAVDDVYREAIRRRSGAR